MLVLFGASVKRLNEPGGEYFLETSGRIKNFRLHQREHTALHIERHNDDLFESFQSMLTPINNGLSF